MPELGHLVQRVRSKNAGPFWLTIDIFCGDAPTFTRITKAVPTARVAQLYAQPQEAILRFEVADLHVLKFSMPRPNLQGSRLDRDMHASQWAWLIAELDIA